jgi:DNA ligase-1
MLELKIMKAPSKQIPVEEMPIPMLCSLKLDGIRCLIKDGKIHSASMRLLPNKNLPSHLSYLIEQFPDQVFDGELYSHILPFQEHTSLLMAHTKQLPNHLAFHCFDTLPLNQWGTCEIPYSTRYKTLKETLKTVPKNQPVCLVEQRLANTHTDIHKWYNKAIEADYEGLMVRDPNGLYKNGRATIKQANIFKIKSWTDYDGEIIGVYEMEGIKTGAERVIDPTGHRRAVHKKDDRETKGTLGGFLIKLEDGTETRVGAWKGLTHAVRTEIWLDKESYIGKWVRFKSQACGEKDKPRLRKNLEFRDPK